MDLRAGPPQGRTQGEAVRSGLEVRGSGSPSPLPCGLSPNTFAPRHARVSVRAAGLELPCHSPAVGSNPTSHIKLAAHGCALVHSPLVAIMLTAKVKGGRSGPCLPLAQQRGDAPRASRGSGGGRSRCPPRPCHPAPSPLPVTSSPCWTSDLRVARSPSEDAARGRCRAPGRRSDAKSAAREGDTVSR